MKKKTNVINLFKIFPNVKFLLVSKCFSFPSSPPRPYFECMKLCQVLWCHSLRKTKLCTFLSRISPLLKPPLFLQGEVPLSVWHFLCSSDCTSVVPPAVGDFSPFPQELTKHNSHSSWQAHFQASPENKSTRYLPQWFLFLCNLYPRSCHSGGDHLKHPVQFE